MSEVAGELAAIRLSLQEMSANINLIPALSENVSAFQCQLQELKAQIESNVKANESTSNGLAVISQRLLESNNRANALKAELKRTNLVIYNLEPTNPPKSTLMEEVMYFLNWFFPTFNIVRSDIKDAFRIGSANGDGARPVLLKLNSKELRDLILRNNRTLKRYGISAAPDYTAQEREARSKLKPCLQEAIQAGRDVKLRGTKLFIDGNLFVYDNIECIVKEITEPRRIPQGQNAYPPIAQLASQKPQNPSTISQTSGDQIQFANPGPGSSSRDDRPAPSDRDETASNSSDVTVVPNERRNIQESKGRGRKLSEIISPDDKFRTENRNVRIPYRRGRGDTRPGRPNRGGRGPSRFSGPQHPADRDDYYKIAFPPMVREDDDEYYDY